MFDNAVNMPVEMGPCNGKPWDEVQLGMPDWCESCSPRPTRDNPTVVITNNYYNAPRLRYVVEGR